MGRGAADGSFDIKNVPNGTYQVTLWDDDQDYIIWSFNARSPEARPERTSASELLVGCFTRVHGSVFVDANGNGKRDPGERGRP